MTQPPNSVPGNSRSKALRALACLLLAFAWCAPAAEPFSATNLLRKGFWDTDGTINAIATANGTVYVGGSFSYVSPRGRKVAAVDAYTGQLQSEFPRIFGSAIHAILEDGNGGWFIAGEFSEVGGLPRTNLVHLLSGFAVDPEFRPDPNGAVFALASDGDRLFVGGDFTRINGQPRSRLAAFSLSNNLLTAWAPEPNERVSALLVAEDRIFVGGSFTSIGGLGASRLAALDAQSGGVLPWFPQPDGPVLAMAVLDHRLFAGGSFNIIGGALRGGTAAVDVQTGSATEWDPQLSGGEVTALRAVCGTVYLGGRFTNVRGVPRNRVAAVDSDLGLPTPWDAGLALLGTGNMDSAVLALELSADTLYICGEFEIPGVPLRRDLAAVDAATGQLLPWNPNLDGGVSAVAVGGRFVLAGFVNAPGGVERQNLAAFDALSGKATGWNPGADNEVLALVASDNTVFAGGSFANAGGQSRQRLAALDATSGLALSNWSPAANGAVFALALDGGTLYAGGSFTTLGGSNLLRLAALDAESGHVRGNWFVNVFDGSVRTLALTDNTLYFGGTFSAVGGNTRNNLAAVDAGTGQLRFWDPDADGDVLALAVTDNTVFAGGDFLAVAGLGREHLAAIDATTGLPTAWSPEADGVVHALAVSGDTIYVGGVFTSLVGQQRFGVAAVDNTGRLLDWHPGASSTNRCSALTITEEALFVAGSDLHFQASPSSHSLAVFPRTGVPAFLATPRDQNVPVGQNAMFTVGATGVPPLSFQWWFNGVPLASATNATLLLSNVQPSQSGAYEVIVSNAFGSAVAEATLIVLVPVTITAQPSDFIGDATNSIVLAVNATGSPQPNFQWRRNGVNIPGAVFPTFTLTDLSATGGGSYHVVVANSLGAANSRVCRVVIGSPPLPFADNFNAAGTLSGASGVVRGNNSSATTQGGEPLHAGKAGGRSVWVRWIAPASGTVAFETRGSGFDTLLAVYTGDNISNLTSVAADEDRGGFLTGRAIANVTSGTEYSIAVDGLAGASGDVVLSWQLDPGTREFPRILAHPVSQTTAPGGTATFSVFATSATAVTFQWFFGCQAIDGATSSVLTITNAQRRNVGSYRVFVMNDSTHVAESLPAALELGLQAGSHSFDKFQDLLTALPPTGAGQLALASVGLGGDPLLVSMGSIVSQTFNTSSNTTSLGESNHCGVIGGHSTWLAFKPGASGVMQVDTVGSGFDTVLAVYRNTNLLTLLTNPAAALVECDNNSAPDGTRSQLRFAATSGSAYLAVVDGVNGARGLAKINWRLGLAPTSSPPATNLTTLSYGSALTLAAGTAGGIPPPVYQWRLNGTNLPGATSSNLVVSNVNPAMAGAYSVIVSNFAGVTTNLLATVAVHVPLRLENGQRPPNHHFTCQVMGNAGQLFAVQASSDLEHWITIHTNRLAQWLAPFSDTNAPQFNHRFYRVIPWLSLDAQAVRAEDIVRFRIRGRSSQPFVLESCDSWTDWIPIYTNALPDVPMDFLDPRPANTLRRFYRGRLL